MPIQVACQCGQRFAAKEELAGKTVKCPKCGSPLAIPGPAAKQNANPQQAHSPQGQPQQNWPQQNWPQQGWPQQGAGYSDPHAAPGASSHHGTSWLGAGSAASGVAFGSARYLRHGSKAHTAWVH